LRPEYIYIYILRPDHALQIFTEEDTHRHYCDTVKLSSNTFLFVIKKENTIVISYPSLQASVQQSINRP